MTPNAQPLLISVENIASGRQLTVCGDVDLATAPQFRDTVLRHLATARSLSLDLEGVAFMDSSGLHALIACRRRAALLGHPLLIARASPAVDRLLEVTGTTALFTRAATNPGDVSVTPLDRSTELNRL
jgi:stage II sporulation protein AA (anti-sigma F factor antagonist)